MPHHQRAGLASLLLLFVLGCGDVPRETPVAVGLVASGSTTMMPLLAELASALHNRAPEVSVEVVGAGTARGLEDLSAGRADLAMASWLPPDLSADWQATAIARDGIAVVVHPTNPLGGVGLLQLQGLFGGALSDWGAVGSWRAGELVEPVIREQGSGTRSAFEALVMAGQRVTPRAVIAPSNQAAVDYVASHPAAIGCIPLRASSERVKVIRIEGELPGPTSVSDGTYPIVRELWLVYRSPPSRAVADVLSFALGAEGQRVVAQGYSPP